MKASFCINVFETNKIFESIEKLSSLGYDGIEIWQQNLEKLDLKILKEFLENKNISVSQVCPYFDFTGNEQEYKKSIKLAEKFVEIANFLNCKNIRVFTGKIGSREVNQNQWEMCVKGLRRVCEIDKNIFFVIETHPNTLADTSYSTLKLLKDVCKENLKVNLQVPLIHEPDPLISAEILGEYVVHLHAHNWKYLNPDYSWGELTYLDSGVYNFEEFISILFKKGFDGYISIEHGDHLGKSNPLVVAEHEIKYLKRLIKKFNRKEK